jgi:hypothetical protein
VSAGSSSVHDDSSDYTSDKVQQTKIPIIVTNANTVDPVCGYSFIRPFLPQMDDVESWVEPFFDAHRSEILHREILEGSIAEAEREAERQVPLLLCLL